MAQEYLGENGEFPLKELELLIAEGRYRTNNRNAAMQIVNKYRANGELPAFTDASGVAPGGPRCVPRTITGACGDLWEALKYEKRIEVWHYGMGTEFFDDRGWGDLVKGTLTQLPVPGAELMLLLEDIYTFGGGGLGSAQLQLHRIDADQLRARRDALEAFDRAMLDKIALRGVH